MGINSYKSVVLTHNYKSMCINSQLEKYGY